MDRWQKLAAYVLAKNDAWYSDKIRNHWIYDLQVFSEGELILCCDRVQFNGDLVIASPEVYQIAFGSDAEFVILASDGLWDYMNRCFIPSSNCIS